MLIPGNHEVMSSDFSHIALSLFDFSRPFHPVIWAGFRLGLQVNQVWCGFVLFPTISDRYDRIL